MKRKLKQRVNINKSKEVHYYTVAYSIQQYFTFQSMAYCVVYGLKITFEALMDIIMVRPGQVKS